MGDAQWILRQSSPCNEQPLEPFRLWTRAWAPLVPQVRAHLQMETDVVTTHEVRVWSGATIRLPCLPSAVPSSQRTPEAHESAQSAQVTMKRCNMYQCDAKSQDICFILFNQREPKIFWLSSSLNYRLFASWIIILRCRVRIDKVQVFRLLLFSVEKRLLFINSIYWTSR